MSESGQLTAEEWNATWPIGTRVSVTLVDGNVNWTRTKAAAIHVGEYDFIEVDGMLGLVLLDWCAPLEPPSQETA